jgi:hypothetical protein
MGTVSQTSAATKVCPSGKRGCGLVKPLSDFFRDKHRKDGVQTYCKDCRKKYWQENPEKRRELEKNWRNKNKHKTRATWRRYFERNKDTVRKHNREYRRTLRKTAREKEYAIIRRSKLIRVYGITSAGYDEMLRTQGGVCAICGVFRLAKNRKYLHIDHDHTTGKVRGLLCNGCNSSLGLLKEDPMRMLHMIEYVAKHSGV